MLSSADLKKIVTEARPLIEQQLDLTEQVAGLREVVTAAGGDWSQLKALVKAQIQDERDEAGEGKRVRKILDKADYAQGYADMLGLANMNEKNSFAEQSSDAWLEEVVDHVDPELLHMIVEGSKTEAGRQILRAAIEVVKTERQPEHDPETGEIIESNSAATLNSQTPPGSEVAADPAKEAAGPQQASSADSSTGNVGASAGRLHSSVQAPTESTASVLVEPPTAAENARSIRPWCLHADDLSKCGGYGRKHCETCLKARADAEGFTA